MEREKFEQSWKHAFDEAEISPSEKVWTNIELDLEKAKGGELKRRLMFYQMLAAACVVFAMTIGVRYYYTFKNQPDSANALAGNETRQRNTASDMAELSDRPREETTSADKEISTTPDRSLNADESKTSPTSAQKNIANEPRVTKTVPHQNGVESASIATSSKTGAGDNDILLNSPLWAAGQDDSDHPGLPRQIEDDKVSPLYTGRDIKLNFTKKEQEVDPVVAMLAKLEQREREVQDEDDRKKSEASGNENLWTSIGFAAGSFNAVQAPSASNGAGSVSTMALAAPVVDQESKASGYSYSMGLNIGTRISERWVLQGGVNYLTQSSEYTANSLVADGPGFLSAERYKPMTTNDVVNSSEHELASRVVYSAPYNVNNSMRYLSIPMQAGYLLVNKTFGLQLNAGVATDLFLRNTVKGDSDQLASATQSGGSDSPYRTVNLSGLVGTEFSYRFGPHYRISLNPGIRYPLNTIYKSELGVQSSPLTFDVGLRFRYIFH